VESKVNFFFLYISFDFPFFSSQLGLIGFSGFSMKKKKKRREFFLAVT